MTGTPPLPSRAELRRARQLAQEQLAPAVSAPMIESAASAPVVVPAVTSPMTAPGVSAPVVTAQQPGTQLPLWHPVPVALSQAETTEIPAVEQLVAQPLAVEPLGVEPQPVQPLAVQPLAVEPPPEQPASAEPLLTGAETDSAHLFPTLEGEQDAPPKKRRTVLFALLAALLLLISVGGFVAFRTWQAASALQRMAVIVPELEQQFLNDPDDAPGTLVTVQQAAQTAANATSGPLFGLATRLPAFGDDLQALRTVSVTAQQLTHEVFPNLFSALHAADPDDLGFRELAANLAPRQGVFDIQPLLAAQPGVLAANATVTNELATIRGIEREGLLTQLADATDQVQSLLAQISTMIGTAARAVELVPPMLGADGPRTWLVLITNNSTTRALGGTVESVLEVSVNNGQIEVVQSIPTAGLPALEASNLFVGGQVGESEVFSAESWTLADVTTTPDFPRVAEKAIAIWQALGLGLTGTPQGVVAIDAVAFDGLLAATGQVTFFDPVGHYVHLDADVTSDFLLSALFQIYPDPAIQQQAFVTATRAIFEHLVYAGFNGTQLLGALDRAAAEGRLQVWSADTWEQSRLADTLLAGELRGVSADIDGVASPVVGVYLNLLADSRLGFYLNTIAWVTGAVELPDGSQELTLRVDVRNTLDSATLAGLPSVVRGTAPADGTLPVRLAVFAPLGGSFAGLTDDAGNPLAFTQDVLAGLPVAWADVEVPAEGGVTFQFQMLTGPNQPGAVQLRATPSIH